MLGSFAPNRLSLKYYGGADRFEPTVFWDSFKRRGKKKADPKPDPWAALLDEESGSNGDDEAEVGGEPADVDIGDETWSDSEGTDDSGEKEYFGEESAGDNLLEEEDEEEHSLGESARVLEEEILGGRLAADDLSGAVGGVPSSEDATWSE